MASVPGTVAPMAAEGFPLTAVPASAGQGAGRKPEAMPMSTVHHIYLSPHLDDAVLSCGATIAQQVAGGESVKVVTIFAGCPPLQSLSPYAAQMHRRWGDESDPVGKRRREDEAACRILGAVPIHLDYLDAPCRTDPADGGFLYTSDEYLFAGRIHSADFGLVDDLATDIARRWGNDHEVLFYAPLGVGGHVDHQIVREAAFKLQRRGFSLRFYEDFPYVEDGHALVGALARPDGYAWMAELRWAQEQHVAVKCEAIACYRSQMPNLFGDTEAMARRVRAYMTLVGGERYAERFWTGKPCSSPK